MEKLDFVWQSAAGRFRESRAQRLEWLRAFRAEAQERL